MTAACQTPPSLNEEVPYTGSA